MLLAMELHAHWGRRLRELRLERGLSINSLSRLADVDPAGLSKIERGLQSTSDDRRLRIAAALGVDPNEIWSYPAEVAS